MAQNRQNQFIKRKKELERKRKAMEKMERRQGKRKQKNETSEDMPEDQAGNQPSENLSA